jgi:glucosamine-6-phosphate deaminase
MTTVRVIPSVEWAAEVAAAWRARLAERPMSRLCLATGSTPIPVYDELARDPGPTWARTSVLLLDEFGALPVDEPESCDAVLRRSLIDHVHPGSYRAIRPDEPDLAAELDEIDHWLDGGLDLAVLGLGANGHVGMNEPGSPRDARTRRVELAATTVAGAQRYFGGRCAPTWGVTVGVRDLLASREVWVLVTGAAKATIVRECLQGPVTTEVPASLLQEHADCTWWLDEAAASAL